MNRMSQKQRGIGIVLLAVWCFSLLTDISLAAISPEELQKIETAMPAKPTVTPKEPRKMLIFNLCEGYVHSSIPYGAKALEIMGRKTGAFETVISSDMAVFKPESLSRFDAVCFNNTSQLEFKDTELRKSLMDFVKAGKGIVGIHAATDCFYTWPEAAEMMGGLFDGHPWCANDNVWVEVVDIKHPLCKTFRGQGFELIEEMYQFKQPYSRQNLRVLLRIDTEKTNMNKEGLNRRDGDFAVSWVRSLGKGRIFYCSLGHNHNIFWNPAILQHYLDGIQFALGDLPADTTPSSWNFQALDEILKRVAAYRYGQSRKPLTELAEFVNSAYDNGELLKQIENRLLEFLRSDATVAGKQFVCRKLSVIGTDMAVPTLAAMLTNPSTSDMARYALERIPGTAVDQALLQNLPKTTGKTGIGIINTLGMRGNRQSVSILAELIYDRDINTAVAAVAALGRIAGPEAAKSLTKAKDKSSGKLREMILDASLNCADQLVNKGLKAQALQIYRQLYRPSEPATVRVAALRGMASAMDEQQAGKMIVDVLKGRDEEMKIAATGLVREISQPQIIKAVAEELSKLSSAGQVQLLSALADRGGSGALPAVVAAAKSSDQPVRIAALAAIAKLGNHSNVLLLAQAAAKSTGKERDTARESLYRIRGQNVNRTILTNIKSAAIGSDVKIELIRSTAERNISIAVETLFETAQHSDVKVRTESLRALKVAAGPEHLSRLINALVNAKNDSERNEAEKTVAVVANKIPERNRQAQAVLKLLESVKDVKAKCSLLNVLGKIGDNSALPALRAALTDKNQTVKDAAVRALSEWPIAEAMDDLLEVVSESDSELHRVLALRGYVRLMTLPSDRPRQETSRMCYKAMDLATNKSERKMVLSGLADVDSLTALKIAADYLDDNDLQAEAEVAVAKIAKTICGSYPQDVTDVLAKLLRISDNGFVRKQANETIERIKGFEDYITSWELSGPYSDEIIAFHKLLDKPFPPEQPDAKGVIWRIMPAGTTEDRPWFMDFIKVIGGGENIVAYLRTGVWSPQEQKVRLELGSNDGIKAWLNGEVIHTKNVERLNAPGEDKVEVTLKKGWNPLLLKITQSGGRWSACARFRTPGGGKLEGLKIQVED